MVRVFFLFFVVALLKASHGAPADSNSDGDWRIIGGSDAAVNDAEYQVSLRSLDNFHFCSGAIITPRTVLTVAQCVVYFAPSTIVVYANTTTLDAGGSSYGVSSIIIHPAYDKNKLQNDLAVIIIDKDIVTDSGAKLIKLGTSHVGGGVDVMLTGWGPTSYPGTSTNNLQKIMLKTISYLECKRIFIFVRDTEICTFTKTGEGACGDNGSVLVHGDELVGLATWGYSPCAAGYPDGYTRISEFIPWIIENSL